MTNRHLFSAGLVLLATVLGQAAWAASVGTSGGQWLISASTARNSGLGEAADLLTDDPGVVLRNPAGVASMKRIGGLFTHQMGIAMDYSENLNLAFPTQMGVVGVSLIYHGMDPLNDAGGEEPSINVSDMLGMLTFARREDRLLEGLAYGVNVKFLNSTLGEYSANAVAADAGVTWQALRDLVFGFSARNLGTRMKFIEESDSLPMFFTLAGKYTLLSDSAENFFLALSVDESAEAATSVRLGGEFAYADTFFARLGYAYNQAGGEGISFGIGIQTAIAATTLRFDYAYKTMPMSSDLMNSMQFVTVGVVY